jgi:hypothetical protein
MALKNFTQFTPQTILSATDFMVGYRQLDEIRTDLNSLTDAISGLLILKGFTPGGSLGSVRRVSYRYTIGAGSPVNAVSGVDDFGLTLSYTPGQIEVYRNGSHLVESLDFLATNSTQIRNLSTLNLGDIVEVVALSATGVTVIETLTGSGVVFQSNYRYTVPISLANGAVTVTGPDDFGSTLRYAAPNLDVYLNGSHLVNSYDYIATDGVNITLYEPVATGDVVDVQTLSSVGTGAVYGLSAFSGVSRIVAQNGVATSSSGGLGVVTLSADIQGRTLKASPVAGDEVMIYDSVAKDNKKTTVATLTSLAYVDSRSFAFVKNATQTVVADTVTKVSFQTTLFNNAGITLLNNEFTPTRSGYYLINANLYCPNGGSGFQMQTYLYKNGSPLLLGTMDSTGANTEIPCTGQLTGVVNFNGTTDYFELYAKTTHTKWATGGNSTNSFLPLYIGNNPQYGTYIQGFFLGVN